MACVSDKIQYLLSRHRCLSALVYKKGKGLGGKQVGGHSYSMSQITFAISVPTDCGQRGPDYLQMKRILKQGENSPLGPNGMFQAQIQSPQPRHQNRKKNKNKKQYIRPIFKTKSTSLGKRQDVSIIKQMDCQANVM